MFSRVLTFVFNDHGAVTVDWTVLSAAATSMAIATAGVLNGGIDGLVSRLEGELRTQQLSDDFVIFTSEHFEPLYESGITTAEDVETMFATADSMMNQDVIDALEYGIEALENGELSPEDIVLLVTIASVASQRNIVDDGVLDYYFGFGGDTARYEDALPPGA